MGLSEAAWLLSLTCLRATTVMVHALAAGCEAVIPCGEIDEAREIAASLPEGTALLGRRAAGPADPGFRPGKLAGRLHAAKSARERRSS